MQEFRLLVISFGVSADTAYASRLSCIVQGFKKNGVSIKLLCLCPNIEYLQYLDKEGIEYENLSIGQINKYLGFIIGCLRMRKYFGKDKIIWHSSTHLFLITWLLVISKGSRIIHERSEDPSLTLNSQLFGGLKTKWYIKLCSKHFMILTISKVIRDYFIEHGILPDRIQIFPMVVNPNRFESIPVDTRFGEYIAYSGDMGNNKDGLDNLIESFHIFSKDKPNVKLLLIGDSKNKEVYEIYKKRVKSLGLERKVVFTGRVSSEKIPFYICNARVLALARPDNKQSKAGFPTKLGEYLSTGIPVVITRTGEIDEYLEDNKDCFFVKPGDPKAFADKLLDVFSEYDFAKIVGNYGKMKAYSVFNYIVQTKKILDLLK